MDVPETVEEAISVCRACPWSKNCLEPPGMSPEEEKQQIEGAKSRAGEVTGSSDCKEVETGMLSGLLQTMFFAGSSLKFTGCPIFVKRYQANPDIAQALKAFMQGDATDIKQALEALRRGA